MKRERHQVVRGLLGQIRWAIKHCTDNACNSSPEVIFPTNTTLSALALSPCTSPLSSQGILDRFWHGRLPSSQAGHQCPSIVEQALYVKPNLFEMRSHRFSGLGGVPGFDVLKYHPMENLLPFGRPRSLVRQAH